MTLVDYIHNRLISLLNMADYVSALYRCILENETPIAVCFYEIFISFSILFFLLLISCEHADLALYSHA
jgi:hypothetical protein